MISIQLYILTSLIVGIHGNLYGVAPTNLQLETIDPESGSATTISPIYSAWASSSQQTAVDCRNRIFYSIVFDENANITYLIGFDLTNSSSIKYQIVLPIVQVWMVGYGLGLDVDSNTGDILLYGHKTPSQPHTLFRVIPSKNSVEPIMTFGGGDALGGISAFDATNRIYWIEIADASGNNPSFLGIDVDSATVKYHVSDTQFNVSTLAWDPVNELMYGIGLAIPKNGNSYSTLVSLNSKTGKFHAVATFPEYSQTNGPESTIDWKNRILYSILNIDSNSSSLVGINIDTQKIVSSPQICSGYSCPISLEFLNPPLN